MFQHLTIECQNCKTVLFDLIAHQMIVDAMGAMFVWFVSHTHLPEHNLKHGQGHKMNLHATITPTIVRPASSILPPNDFGKEN